MLACRVMTVLRRQDKAEAEESIRLSGVMIGRRRSNWARVGKMITDWAAMAGAAHGKAMGEDGAGERRRNSIIIGGIRRF